MARKVLGQDGFSLAFVFLNVKSRIHPAADFASIHACVMDTEARTKNSSKVFIGNAKITYVSRL
jgi:hypothetical protein